MNDSELNEVIAEIGDLWPDAGFTEAEIALFRAELAKHDRDLAINEIREARLTSKFKRPDHASIFRKLRGDTAAKRHARREETKRKSPPDIQALRNASRELYGMKVDFLDDVEFVLRHGRGLYNSFVNKTDHAGRTTAELKAIAERRCKDIEREIGLLLQSAGFSDDVSAQAATCCTLVTEDDYVIARSEWVNALKPESDVHAAL